MHAKHLSFLYIYDFIEKYMLSSIEIFVSENYEIHHIKLCIILESSYLYSVGMFSVKFDKKST